MSRSILLLLVVLCAFPLFADPLAVTTAFAPPFLNLYGTGTTSRMRVLIANPNGDAATNLAFTDSLPAHLFLAADPAVLNTCGGTVTAQPGGTTVTLAGGTLAPATQCEVSALIVADTYGVFTNSLAAGAVTSTTSINTVPASASIEVRFGEVPDPPQPYPSFITGFPGRFLDSASVIDYQGPNRTLRADRIKAAPERDAIYMKAGGGTFVRYRLSEFASQAGGNPFFGPHLEASSSFDDALNPEAPGSGWTTPAADGQERLTDFDWDDRGLTYLAYSLFGWGIVDEQLDLVRQELDESFSPQQIVAFRNGATYYALVSDNAAARLFDVTDPAAPLLMPVAVSPFRAWAKAGDRIALVRTNNTIEIHSPQTLAAGTAALATFNAPAGRAFLSITTDGTSFYATDNHASAANLYAISPALALTTHPTVVRGGVLGYGAGYLTIAANSEASVFEIAEGTPVLLDETYLTNFYGEMPFARLQSLLPIHDGDETLLLVGAHGLGDLFSMAAVLTPVTISKEFPGNVVAGVAATMRITIHNPNDLPVQLAFTDVYPNGLVTASATTATTCTAATIATTPGSFTFDGGVAAGTTCEVIVSVRATQPGNFTNVIAAGTFTGDTTNGNAASATLVVTAPQPPSVQKSFQPSSALPGQEVLMTIALTNHNLDFVITGVAFTDSYPAGLTNATDPRPATNCGAGTVTALPGGSSVALGGGSIPPIGGLPGSSTCFVSVWVVATANATNSIPTGAITTANAGANTTSASATLTASSRPSVTKSFAAPSIVVGTPVRLTITLTNPNAFAMTGVAFTDYYPAYLINALSPQVESTCGGTVTASPNGTWLALSGGTIPASSACSVSLFVQATSAGGLENYLPPGSVTSANAPPNGAAASAALAVLNPDAIPTLSEWAMLMLVALFATFALLRLRP